MFGRRATLPTGIPVVAMMTMMVAACGGDSNGAAGTGGSGGAAGIGGATGGAGGNGGTSMTLGPPGFGVVITDRGSNLTLRRPDQTEESIDGDNVLGWVNGQLLDGDYYKQLRIATTLGAMELRLSFPGTAPPDGLIEAVHDLRATRLALQDTGDLESLQVEIWFSSSDPPFSPFTNARGEVEIFLDVENGFAIYEIVGEVNLTLEGDGGTHSITGTFWLKDAAP